MSDLLFQNFTWTQSNQQPATPTVASAATIAVTSFYTVITGTTAIATITPPVSGPHALMLQFTNANPGGVTTGGNIAAALDPAQNQLMILVYNSATKTYRAGVLALS